MPIIQKKNEINKQTNKASQYLHKFTTIYLAQSGQLYILVEDNNALDYFIYYDEKKYLLDNKKQDIKKDQKNLINKSSDSKSVKNMLFRHTHQDELLINELSLSLKEVQFNK